MAWQPIIVGVDASTEAAAAAGGAVQLARMMATSCHLVHAARPVWIPAGTTPGGVDEVALGAEVQKLARRELERHLTGHVPPELLADLEIRTGTPGEVLNAVAHERGAGMIVLGGKRHHLVARWLGGSTAKRVLRAADLSVLVAAGPTEWTRILAAADVSDASLPTIRTALRMAELTGAKVRVVHAIEPFPYTMEGTPAVDLGLLAEQEEAAFRKTVWSKVADGTADLVVRPGGAVAVIEDEAAEWKADLVVVGAHGRRGMERLLLGSVSEGVVHHLPASVLVVRGAG